MKILLFFHGMRYVEFHLSNKTFRTNRDTSNASQAGFLVETVAKAWVVLTSKHMDFSPSDPVRHYIFFNEGTRSLRRHVAFRWVYSTGPAEFCRRRVLPDAIAE